LPRQTPVGDDGRFGFFGNFFKRTLDVDMVVLDDRWLRESGVQQKLEFEGYQLRWVGTHKLDLNMEDGWQFVTVPRYLWWLRRVRRRHGPQVQYLLKRGRSFRSRDSVYSVETASIERGQG
jgi:hypothetical protein